MITKETIEVEPIKDSRKLLVKRYIEDELEPKEFNDNFKQVDDALKNLTQRLKDLDQEKEKAKEFLEKQISELTVRADGLRTADSISRIWAEEIKQEHERKSNPLVS
jgi:chromosome segregation ATPase